MHLYSTDSLSSPLWSIFLSLFLLIILSVSLFCGFGQNIWGFICSSLCSQNCYCMRGVSKFSLSHAGFCSPQKLLADWQLLARDLRAFPRLLKWITDNGSDSHIQASNISEILWLLIAELFSFPPSADISSFSFFWNTFFCLM